MPPGIMIEHTPPSAGIRRATRRPVVRWLSVLLAILTWMPGAASAADDDVLVEPMQFGVGNRFRPGDFTAMQIQLQSQLDEPQTVWAQWEIPNVDGDIAEYGRAVTLTPGFPTPLWLYAPVPHDARPDTIWSVRVYEYEDGQRGAELGGTRVSPTAAGATSVAIDSSRIGIIGDTNTMGLGGYPYTGASDNDPIHVAERTQINAGLRPNALPDRWEGLMTFEAIVWVELSPQDLNQNTTEAIYEYIRRGGHLIIVLPETGDPWSLGTPGKVPFELERVLPQSAPRRDVDVPLADLLPIMSKAERAEGIGGAPINFNSAIRVFKDDDFNAIDNHYIPHLALNDGRVVVIRRSVGHGMISVVGIDISSGQLGAVRLSNGARGLPQADQFWNPILGRRSDTPTSSELIVIAESGRSIPRRTSQNNLGSGGLVSNQIKLTSAATVGLLFAFLLFAAYLTIAGPGGFVVLRSMKKVHLSWLLFVASAFVFSGIAWGIVSISRDHEITVRHYTVLDHIYRASGDQGEGDPQLQRAISWFSLYTPGYGRRAISIEGDDGQRDLLSTWIPPGDTPQPFPDVTRYRIDVGRTPARLDDELDGDGATSFERPSRATATTMYANWMGGLDREWGSLIRPEPGSTIEVVRDRATGLEATLSGVLRHDLPGQLEDVLMIWVKSQRGTPRRYAQVNNQETAWVPQNLSGRMLNTGVAYARGPWDSGETWDLSALPPGDPLTSAILKNFHDAYAGDDGTSRPQQALSSKQQVDYLYALSIFHQLEPPKWLKQPANQPTASVAMYREFGRELDLSRWMTQPCVIIIGRLRNVDTPFPLRVDGEPVEADEGSVTFVRWILPLPFNEDLAFPMDSRADNADVAMTD